MDVKALQVSPLVVEATEFESLADGSLDRAVISAPAGTVERRYAIALALRALVAGGELVVLAPKDKGGTRLQKELEGFGCIVAEDSRRHHRICQTRRPDAPQHLEAALADGALQMAPRLGLWSQPGVFSWDRLDAGTAMLIKYLPKLAGRGADLGCGVGVLAQAVIAQGKLESLHCLDIDRRAVDAARRNLLDTRAMVLHADARGPVTGLENLDFVIMNPPFHDGSREDRSLGQAFIASAARALRNGGLLYLVANIGLPYEAALIAHFREQSLIVKGGGYKIYEARK